MARKIGLDVPDCPLVPSDPSIKSLTLGVPPPDSAVTPFRGYAWNPHIVFVEKCRELAYFDFGMNRKTVCLTCKNKCCVARCRFHRPEPVKIQSSATKEVTK